MKIYDLQMKLTNTFTVTKSLVITVWSMLLFNENIQRNWCVLSSMQNIRDSEQNTGHSTVFSVAVLADVSVRSPRKLYIVVIYKEKKWVKVSKAFFYFILKTKSLTMSNSVTWKLHSCCLAVSFVSADPSFISPRKTCYFHICIHTQYVFWAKHLQYACICMKMFSCS